MIGLRGRISTFLPSWLNESGPIGSVGYRILWTITLLADAGIHAVSDGEFASRARGSPTSLKYLGPERGIIRGQIESDDDYAEKLRGWIWRVKEWGSSLAIARVIHDYLYDHPRVRVINRSGLWVMLDRDGTVTRGKMAWDWDSISNPERANNWWETWVVVYPAQWQKSPVWGTPGKIWGVNAMGLGHSVRQSDYTIIASEIEKVKGAHTHVRCVIWTSDPDRFDPNNSASCPDGTWGMWGTTGDGPRVPSGRDLTTCRYWEYD